MNAYVFEYEGKRFIIFAEDFEKAAYKFGQKDGTWVEKVFTITIT